MKLLLMGLLLVASCGKSDTDLVYYKFKECGLDQTGKSKSEFKKEWDAQDDIAAKKAIVGCAKKTSCEALEECVNEYIRDTLVEASDKQQKSEFHTMLTGIAHAVALYYSKERVSEDGLTVRPKSLPESIPQAPKEVSCDKKLWGSAGEGPHWDRWAELGYKIDKPFLGHYELVKVSDTEAKVIVHFDVNCDGKIGRKSISVNVVEGMPRIGLIVTEEDD